MTCTSWPSRRVARPRASPSPTRRPARSTACSTGPASARAPACSKIGTGWGELAIRAAQRGAHVRSVTLSIEQLDLARARITAAGVADRVHV